MGALDFGAAVRRARSRGRIVVQPRMGFADPGTMRAGLRAVAAVPATTAGTITLDSYTRTGQYPSVLAALRHGARLNGYPIVTHGPAVTRRVIDGLQHDDFQIQVRHGSAAPMDIVAAMTGAGLYATEGGPVSYCLPYGRTPIGTSVRNWRQSCERLAAARRPGVEPHLETFGGCLLGQLCPPGLLVAVSLLEAVFFRRHGLRSVSLSYTQQTDARQDAEALAALRLLATEYLPDVDWHIVLYAYMGRFPATPAGARRLAARAASLAVAGGADRLIVKTAAEAHRIPTIAENVEALETAAADIAGSDIARSDIAGSDIAGSDIAGSDIAGSDIAGSDIAGPGTARPGTGRAGPPGGRAGDGEVLGEARALIGATLELAEDPGDALAAAVRRGYLDVPYCLHPDNAGRSRSYLAADGRIAWLSVGAMPLRPPRPGPAGLASAGLLDALTRTADRYDADGRIPDGYRPARR